MYRRKHRFFHSILFRISAWILALGLVGMLSVAYFARLQAQYRMEKQITEELVRVRDNSLLSIQQTLLLNSSQTDQESFVEYRREIADQLKSAGYREMALYDANGTLLAGEEARFPLPSEREDFNLARENESAFTLSFQGDNQCEVYFSMPIALNGQQVGLASFYFDYGETYALEWEALTGVLKIAVLLFGLICLVLWLTVFRILSPIRSLSRASSAVADRLKEGQMDTEILGSLRFQRRKDEIGELSHNYMEMLLVIKGQFEKILEDKNHIQQLWHSRQEFYNNVTHELKTPLTTISGYAQLLEKNGLTDERLFYTGTDHILKESTRLHQMVVQLLELQNKDSIAESRQLELAGILKNVRDSLEIKASRYGCRLTLLEGEGPFLVFGCEDRIRQVLINVIDNAIKYGESQQEIRLGIGRKGETIQVTVANQGPGISPEELSNIFEPFYRANKNLSRELGSSGLGLTISAKIMEEHGGSIQAASIPGQETVFTICFPAKEPKEGL